MAGFHGCGRSSQMVEDVVCRIGSWAVVGVLGLSKRVLTALQGLGLY